MIDNVIPATKDRPGSYDAIETLKPGEPVFPIQGGDPFGPATVQFWADQARKAGMAEEDPKKAEALLRKASDAEVIGWQMRDYQRGVATSAAPEEAHRPSARPSYSGWVDTDDYEAKQRRRERTARIEATGRLHNAIAAAMDAVEALSRLRVCPTEEAAIRDAAEQLRDAARSVEPRRGLERT